MAKLNMKKQMANVEREVVKHIRKHGALHYMDLMGQSWHNALDRLVRAKKLRCRSGYYLLPGTTMTASLALRRR